MHKFLVLISLKDWIHNENRTVDLIEVEMPTTDEFYARMNGYYQFEQKLKYQPTFRNKIEKEFGDGTSQFCAPEAILL